MTEIVALLHHGGDLRGRIEIAPTTPLPRKGEILEYDGERFRVTEISHEYAGSPDGDVYTGPPTVHLEISRLRDRY